MWKEENNKRAKSSVVRYFFNVLCLSQIFIQTQRTGFQFKVSFCSCLQLTKHLKTSVPTVFPGRVRFFFCSVGTYWKMNILPTLLPDVKMFSFNSCLTVLTSSTPPWPPAETSAAASLWGQQSNPQTCLYSSHSGLFPVATWSSQTLKNECMCSGAFPLLLQLVHAHLHILHPFTELRVPEFLPIWIKLQEHYWVFHIFPRKLWEKYLSNDTGLQTLGIQEWITKYSAFKSCHLEISIFIYNFSTGAHTLDL